MADLYKIGSSDVIKGAITAVFAAVITVLYGIVAQEHFDLFNADWSSILKMVINSSFGAFVGYMSKNFFSDTQGKFLGKI